MEVSSSDSSPLGVFENLNLCSISRYRSASTLEVDAPSSKEELYWDDTGLAGVCVTVNPMEKFQELDLNEDATNATDNSETEDDDADNVGAKDQLEWDDM